MVDVTELPYECKSSSILPACAPSSAAGPLLTDIANMPMERPNGIFEVDEPSFNGAAQDTAWEDVDMQMDDAYADEDDDSDDGKWVLMVSGSLKAELTFCLQKSL